MSTTTPMSDSKMLAQPPKGWSGVLVSGREKRTPGVRFWVSTQSSVDDDEANAT